MASPTCAVMVVNWNGAADLRLGLPSILAAAARVDAEVWVLDNASTDESAEVVAGEFPAVRFEALPVNRALVAYNEAAERCDRDVIVTLDNDVVVEDGFLPPLLEHFERDDVFGVTATLRPFPPGSAGLHSEATTVRWARGVLRPGAVRPPTTVAPIPYNCGCGSARSRAKFLELGGFDDLYFPLYWEDFDLSWRAWKRGWRCLYEPRSVVYHRSGGSLGRSGRVSALMVRNEFLFHWKNLTTPRFVALHAATLLPRLAVAALRGDGARLAGFARAVPRLPAALARRGAVRAQAAIGDDDVVRRINGAQPAGTFRRMPTRPS